MERQRTIEQWEGRAYCKLTHFIKERRKKKKRKRERERDGKTVAEEDDDRGNRLGSSYTCVCTGEEERKNRLEMEWKDGEKEEGDAWATVSAAEGNMGKWCLSCLSVCILSDSLQSLRQQAGPAGRLFGSIQSLISPTYLFLFFFFFSSRSLFHLPSTSGSHLLAAISNLLPSLTTTTTSPLLCVYIFKDHSSHCSDLIIFNHQGWSSWCVTRWSWFFGGETFKSGPFIRRWQNKKHISQWGSFLFWFKVPPWNYTVHLQAAQ